MKKIVVATKNSGKALEFKKMFSLYNIKVLTLTDYPEIEEIKEIGTTFSENAALKAETVARRLNITTIADDSGLIVDALNGSPGVYSARYAGEMQDDVLNNEKLLVELEGIPFEKRTAHFHCTIALSSPYKKTSFYTGTCSGIIAETPSGEKGFGYDPLFYLPHYKTTIANLSLDEKNKISHRAKAMEQLTTHINEIITEIN